jgi:hypothetical protein
VAERTTRLEIQKVIQMQSDLEKLFNSKATLRVGSLRLSVKKEPTSSEELLVEETEIA